jgi:hypothetical protein
MTDDRDAMTIDPLGLRDDDDADDDAFEDVPDHERRPDRDLGAGLTSSGATAEDRGTDGMPAADFDRRTMEAEGGESEADDDLQTDDGAAFQIRTG